MRPNQICFWNNQVELLAGIQRAYHILEYLSSVSEEVSYEDDADLFWSKLE